MFFVSLAPTLDAALAFVAGGAAGMVLMRVAQVHPAGATLSIVDDDPDAAWASADSIDEPARWSTPAVVESTAVEPRARTGRLPLPERVAALTPSDEPALALVNAFASRLAALSIEAWLDVGRSEVTSPTRTAQRAIAFALLEAAITTHGLGIAAWYARDTIETSVCLATCGAPSAAARDRRLMAAAHGAAEAAALALLARDVLAPADFATLFEPFEHVLTRNELARLAPHHDGWTA